MDLSWDIVVWKEENTIDFIPSSCSNAENTKYKYPSISNQMKIKKMIDLGSPLDEGFIWLDVVCKAKCIKDLQLAKDMCDKGQYTSNLEMTDLDTHGPQSSSKKRKIKKNPNYFSSSSSSDSREKVVKKRQKSMFVRDTFETPRLAGKGNIENINRKQLSEVGHSIKKYNDNSSTTFKKNTIYHCDSGTAPSFSELGIQKHYNTTKRTEFDESYVSNSSPVTPNPVAYSSGNNAPTTTINNELFEIRQGISENRKIMERIEMMLLASSSTICSVDLGDTINLPCETQDEPHSLEAEIQNNTKMKNLISNLYLVGGSTPHKTVYFTMSKIFGRYLALKYSGQGKKKKSSFMDLKLYEAVKAATRKRHPTVSEEDIKKSIGLFLSTAKSRLPKKPATHNNELEGDVQLMEDVP